MNSGKKFTSKLFKMKLIAIIAGLFIFLFVTVLIVMMFFSPLFGLYEFLNNIGQSWNDFWKGSPIGLVTSEENSKELQKFYKKIEDVSKKYSEKYRVQLDTSLIVMTLTYNNDVNNLLNSGDLYCVPNKEEGIDCKEIDYDKASGKIETLAKNMVKKEGSTYKLDKKQYREYLIKTYIPQNLKDFYVPGNQSQIENIADDIMGSAIAFEDWKESALASASPGLLTADATGFRVRNGLPAENNVYFFTGDEKGKGNRFYSHLEAQCTWYAYGRAKEILDNAGLLNNQTIWALNKCCRGDGKGWASANASLPVNKRFAFSMDANQPKVGALISWGGPGKENHVAVVEQVHPDGSITISEANTSGCYNDIWDEYKDTSYNTPRLMECHLKRMGNRWGWKTTKIAKKNIAYPRGYGKFQGYIYLINDIKEPDTDETTNQNNDSTINAS